MSAGFEALNADGTVQASITDRFTRLIGTYSVTATLDWKSVDTGIVLNYTDFYTFLPLTFAFDTAIEGAPVQIRFNGTNLEYRIKEESIFTPSSLAVTILLFQG